MRKKDFAELAKMLNFYWRGGFTEEELKENVDCYWSDYKASQQAKQPVGSMVSLLEQLEDEDPDSLKWFNRISKGIEGKKVAFVVLGSSNEWLLLEVKPNDAIDAEVVADCAEDNWLNNEYYEDCTLYETFEDIWGKRPVSIITSSYDKEEE